MYELLKTIEFKDLTGRKNLLSVLQDYSTMNIRVDIAPLKDEEEKKEILRNRIQYIEESIIDTIARARANRQQEEDEKEFKKQEELLSSLPISIEETQLDEIEETQLNDPEDCEEEWDDIYLKGLYMNLEDMNKK
jgi:hypothetical protein